jgi:Undecaprenyl-phosphate glucose phosphotransferase
VDPAQSAKGLFFPVPVDVLKPLLAGFDFLLIVSLSVLSGSAYHLVAFRQMVSVELFIGSGLAVAALFVSVLQATGMYSLGGPKRGLGKVALIWTLVFLFLTGVAFILKISDQVSRGSVLAFFASGLVTVVVSRVLMDDAVRRALATGSLLGRRVALVTEPSEVAGGELVRTLQRHGCRIEKLVILSEEPHSSESRARSRHELVTALRAAWADEVILALNWSHPTLVAEVMADLRMLPMPVRLVPDNATRKLLERRTTNIGPVIAVELQRAPLSGLEQTCKRVVDIGLSASGLLMLLPLLVLVAIAIRFDSPGPILFRQGRMGFNGRLFRIYKFRTMNVLDDGPVIQQARRGDPRVTRIGRWLRSTSIDELPQLINVLKGEMSLVGPRPHALAHDNEYDQMIADYALRYHVKPGITGWAQVNGFRGETPTVRLMELRVEHDLWYIRNWTFWLDAKILMKTIARQLHESRCVLTEPALRRQPLP